MGNGHGVDLEFAGQPSPVTLFTIVSLSLCTIALLIAYAPAQRPESADCG